MHFKRWISGLTGAVILITILVRGGQYGFIMFVTLASVIAFHEYQRIVRSKNRIKTGKLIFAIGHITGIFILLSAHAAPDHIPIIFAANLIICGSIAVFQSKVDPNVLEVFMYEILGILYIPFFLSYAVLIRNLPHGITLVFWILVVVFTGDVAALYAGTYFGKHKLWPTVSPKKTMEGSMGGICANLFFGLAFPSIFLSSISPFKCVIFSLFVGCIGQVGDLFESLLKRSADVKDSGTIMPGHGGILDRIDAVLFALPFTYYYFLFIL